MAECILQTGVSEFPDGDIFPLTFPLESLIPDTHDSLFRFLDYDLYQLEEPLKRYLSCLDDEQTAKPDRRQLSSAITNLREMHPFFMQSTENVQTFINQTFADYISHTFSDADLTAQREMFSKVSLKHYRTDSDPETMLPEKDDSIFSESPRRVVEDLFCLQDRIRRLVFIILDDTNPGLASLPLPRRTALYGLAYPADSLLYITANFGVKTSDKMRKYILETDFTELPDEQAEAIPDADNGNNLKKCLDELYWKPDSPIPPALREILLATTDVIDAIKITYGISSFSNLLDLEVYRMITEETHIRRCRNCNRYFVPTKAGREYCYDAACEAHYTKLPRRTAAESKAPDAERMTSNTAATILRTPKGKLSQCPSYAPYRKKYKTLKARIKAGTMTAEEFDTWNQQAMTRLTLVVDGKMLPDEYEHWLES